MIQRGMMILRTFKRFSSPFAFPALAACVLAYFAYHTVQGDHGVLSFMRLNNEIARADAALTALRAERLELEHRVRLLDRRSLDMDMLEERIRSDLNRLRRDEVVIFLPVDR